jgi:hypothetical protein
MFILEGEIWKWRRRLPADQQAHADATQLATPKFRWGSPQAKKRSIFTPKHCGRRFVETAALPITMTHLCSSGVVRNYLFPAKENYAEAQTWK